MKQEFMVSGMSCAACSAALEKAVSRLPGINSATVNLLAEKMVVDQDPPDVPALEQVARKLGFGLQALPTDQQGHSKARLEVGGMHCAACSTALERVLNKAPGIIKATVNLATEQAEVIYDPDETNLSAWRGLAQKLGFTLKLEQSSSPAALNRQRQEAKQRELKQQRRRLILAALFTVPLFYLSMGHMLGWPLPPGLNQYASPLNLGLAQLILIIPVLSAGRDFYSGGLKSLFNLAPNMDSLIAIGTGAAVLYSLALFIDLFLNQRGDGHFYFETAAVIITLVMLGKYFENKAKGRTSSAISQLMDLAPATALVVRNGQEEEIAADELMTGDLILLKPGGRVPVDGVIAEGNTTVDQSMLTGESLPVSKKPGDSLAAGSVNLHGAVTFKATRVGSDTTLARIINLVEEAQVNKAPIARLADTVAGYFVPAVITIALAAALIWLLAGSSLTFALTIFIAVLVIACPCALGLATPTAIMVATGKGAELGILIKSGEALETLYKADTVVLDKTGTITQGKPALTDILALKDHSPPEVLALAACLEKNSEHPLAQALLNAASEQNLSTRPVEDFQALPGLGVKARLDGQELLLGNLTLLEHNNINLDEARRLSTRLTEEGKTPMILVKAGEPIGILAVADPMKPSSPEAVRRLKNMGLEVIMLTGDDQRTARAVADLAGIREIRAQVLPEDKAAEVKKLQAQGKKVIMAGDGINDAPALAQAEIGMAVGSGTDIAMESADIVLAQSDLADIVSAIELSRQTLRIIKQNLFWAFIYNILGIPVAAGVLYAFGGPLLNPMLGALAMSLSSVSVVSNALRLKRFKPKIAA